MAEPRIVTHLKEHGRMTARALAEDLGLPYDRVRSKVSHAKRRRLIYIHSWTRSTEESAIDRPCAVYAAGNRPDAVKPEPRTSTERARTHRARKACLMPSVFAASVSIDDRRVTTRKRPDVAARWSQLKDQKDNHEDPSSTCHPGSEPGAAACGQQRDLQAR